MSGDALLGTVLADRYRLDALLGEGGMGKVYSAEHILMRKRLAVKILHRQLTQVPEVVARFEREAMAAAHIDHPNIAAATDFGKLSDGSVYLVLEYVEGHSLRDEIARGPLQVERALHVGRQIAAALSAAHALNIVHRDLKPENVMLVQKGADPDFVKVLDFGIAKVPIGEVGDGGNPITKAGMVYGTPEYMAPEQALGQNVDGRADVYAFGVMLFEMLAGVRPYTAKSQVALIGQMLSQPLPTFAQRAPGVSVPKTVEAFVQRLLAREADERCQSAIEAYGFIEQLLGTTPSSDGRLFTLHGGSPISVTGPGSYRDSAAIFPPLYAPNGSLLRTSAPSIPDGAAVASLGPDSLARQLEPAPLPQPTPANLGVKTGERIITHLNQAVLYLDTRKQELPGALGRALKDVSGRVLLAALAFGALGIITAVIAIIVAVSHGKPDNEQGFVPVASGSASAAPQTSARTDGVDPLDQKIAKAEAAGIAAIEALAKEQPAEGRVLVALARARSKAGKFEEAVQAVSDALAIDPKLNENPRIAGVLFRCAQAPNASSATFRLLEGPMGTRGADIIYDLANTKAVRPNVKSAAEKLLRSKDFLRTASPALEVAVALRRATECKSYDRLLEQAKNVGDARSLEFLKPLRNKTGCGSAKKDDCYACLRGNDLLEQAISTIEKRSAAQKPAGE